MEGDVFDLFGATSVFRGGGGGGGHTEELGELGSGFIWEDGVGEFAPVSEEVLDEEVSGRVADGLETVEGIYA